MIPEGLMMPASIQTPANPFPGLRPFEFGESHLYFGRDGQSDQLIRKLGAARFVAVVGTSGSGKSSLVRAGLLPDLFSGYMPSAGSHWRVALMRPSNDPLGNLARALNAEGVFGSEIKANAQIQTTITEATLRRGSRGLVEAVRQNRQPSNESLLVVVDQFEELFRFARVSASEQYRYEAAAFVKLLLEAAGQREHNIYIVLTMRSDFLGDCAQFWDLPEAINEGQYLIPRLTRDERAEAITGPIAVCGGQITQRLVNRLLNDTGDNTDLLPILQHALMRTWKCWAEDHAEGEALDLRHYETIGTMTDALSLHADEAWGELRDESGRRVAERVFKALTEKGEDNREVRRPTVLGELCALSAAKLSEVISVLDVFRRDGRSFLMPPAAVPLDEESLIDISHESLIRNWQRLKDWVDEESQSAQIYSRLAETAVLYERGQAGLWRDPDLQLALDWRERTRPTGAWAARYHPAFDSAMNFLDASVAARDAALLEEERRRRREIRRTRVVAAVFFVLFMLSLGAVVYAVSQRNEARAALRQVEAANRKANDERAAALVAADRADEQSALAQRSANAAKDAKDVALKNQKEAEESKAEAEKQATLARQNEGQAKAAATRNLQLLYASDMNLALQAYAVNDIRGGRELLNAYAPRAGETADFGWRYLWRLFNSEAITTEVGRDFTMTPDLQKVAIINDGGLGICDYKSSDPCVVLEGRFVNSITLSPDGKYLALLSMGQLDLLEPASGKKVLEFKQHCKAVGFSPDGATLAVGLVFSSETKKIEGKVELWDIASKKQTGSFLHDGGITSVAISSDAKSLIALTTNGTVPLWNIATGELSRLPTEQGVKDLKALAFSPDGKLVAAVGSGGVVKLWDVAARKELTSLKDTGRNTLWNKPGENDFITVAFSPDAKLLAVGSLESSVEIFDVPSLRERATFKSHEGFVDFVAFSPNGNRLFTHGEDKSYKVWALTSLIREREPISLSDDGITGVAFSHDGSELFVGSSSAPVRWDVGTHQPLDTPQLKIDDSVQSFAISRDGTRLAVGGSKLTVWDTTTYNKIATFGERENDTYESIAFSPDGKQLISCTNEEVILWDVDTEKLLKTYVEDGLYSVAFSPDGERIAIGSYGGTVRVWDKTLTREINKNKESAKSTDARDGWAQLRAVIFSRRSTSDTLPSTNDVVFSPDNRYLAVSFDEGVKIWEADGRREIAMLRGHKGAVTAVAFSPNGKTIATGGSDAIIKIWDTSSFKELITLRGHTGSVESIAFSRDGMTLASQSLDRTVRLWRAATDEEIEARRRAKPSQPPR